MKFHILLTCLLVCAAGSFAQEGNSQGIREWQRDSDSILIVYLSRTNNTRAVAQIIHHEVGGELLALELKDPYPEDYDAIVRQVARENETGFLPELKTWVDISRYNLIFLGFPTWGMQLPPPMKSFLHQYDFRGKTLVPFNTNAGYGMGSSLATIRKLAPDSELLEAFSTKGGIERDGVLFVMKESYGESVKRNVIEWLEKIKRVKRF
ncbi:flavodoxin [Robiginitalea sp. SC105]|uniref:flavodoxin n=1 Tax=Robiginitalea sp. SC105 TaxID=2762332 RepID=UPI00163A4C1A|nr:flavodoxin [Robiginitalea sp. SC105]MBC2838845.1 flavodoxin [Robiginitalea sp. SC105]